MRLHEMLEDLRSDLLTESTGGRIMQGRDGLVQASYNPIDYDFRWTKDWYDWDSKAAHKKAMQDRDKVAAEYKAKGYKVKKFTSRGQLVRRGGIGSGHPEIDEVVTVYGFNASQA